MSDSKFNLVPLAIEVRGEVVSSNVAAFRELVTAALSSINRDLKTDDDFGQADADAKLLKTAEENVTAAKAKALADAQSLHALLSQLDETSEEIRTVRLDLEKLVAKRKEEIKAEIIAAAKERLQCALRLREPIYGATLSNAIKGKRTLETMRKALDQAVIMANGQIQKCRVILDQFEGEHGKDMILDREDLEVKRPDQVEGELRRRLDVKRADDQRKLAEADAKAAREEASEAARKLAEEKQPPAPPLPPSPSVRRISPMPGDELSKTGTDEATEWEGFLMLCRSSFAPLKGGREALAHPANKEKAAKFAAAINAAWKEATA